MRTNPVLTTSVFARERADLATIRPMTAEGAAMKALLLLALVGTGGGLAWSEVMGVGARASVTPWVAALIAAGLVALAGTVWPRRSAALALAHALLLGVGLGGVAAVSTGIESGVVLHLAAAGPATVFALLFASNAGLLRRPVRVGSGLMVAAGGLLFTQALALVLDLFGAGMPLLIGLPPLAAALVVVSTGLLGLLLVRDLDSLELEAEMGAPPHMEWHGALALVSAVLWLWFQPLVLVGFGVGNALRGLVGAGEGGARGGAERARALRMVDPDAS